MKFGVLAVVAALLMAWPSSALHARTISDPTAGFRIIFPGDPERASEYNSDIGAQITKWEYDDYSPDEFTFYEFYVVEFPTGWQANNPSDHAAAYANDIVSGSQVLSDRDRTAGKRGWREITARLTPDGAASRSGAGSQLQHVKVITAGNRVYIAHARHNESGSADKARAFVWSLMVSK